MWSFSKPKLNDRVSIDVIIPGWTEETSCIFRNVNHRFLQTFLTRKQIKHLNSLVPNEKYLSIDEESAWKMDIHERAEEKRKENFNEADHIKTDEDYNTYVENNKDKMMMTDEEADKFNKMMEDIAKRREETLNRIEKLESEGKVVNGLAEQAKNFNDFFLKSAGNGKK